MKSRILHSSHLIDFLNDDFKYEKIETPLELEINTILDKYAIVELNEWEIEFIAIYGNLDQIYVCRKNKSQTNTKSKEIVVHIPIPNKNNSDWGVRANQIVKSNFSNKNKYCEAIEIDFRNYSDIYEFINDCMRKAIKHTFEQGFTINNIKIKPLKIA